MLKAAAEAEQLMGVAGLARHEVAAMRHAAVCAGARSAALEARLATFEAEVEEAGGGGELLQRRLDEALATGAAQLKQATLLARGRVDGGAASQAARLDGQTALVLRHAEVAAAADGGGATELGARAPLEAGVSARW